eukprot:3041633-Amphidinium_carterae.1
MSFGLLYDLLAISAETLPIRILSATAPVGNLKVPSPSNHSFFTGPSCFVPLHVDISTTPQQGWAGIAAIFWGL